MKTTLIIFGLCMLLLLVGCVNNKTEEICTIYRHSAKYADWDVYMENGICILSKENATNAYYISCDSIMQKADIIIQTDKGIDEMPKTRWCKIREI